MKIEWHDVDNEMDAEYDKFAIIDIPKGYVIQHTWTRDGLVGIRIVKQK